MSFNVIVLFTRQNLAKFQNLKREPLFKNSVYYDSGNKATIDVIKMMYFYLNQIILLTYYNSK